MIARIVFDLKYAATGVAWIFLIVWTFVGLLARERNWPSNKRRKIQRTSWTVIFLIRTIYDGWGWLTVGKTFLGMVLAISIDLAFAALFLVADDFVEKFIEKEAANIKRRFRF